MRSANVPQVHGVEVDQQEVNLAEFGPQRNALAIHIFRRTGWKPEVISDLTDEQIAMLEQVEPWTPRQDAAA